MTDGNDGFEAGGGDDADFVVLASSYLDRDDMVSLFKLFEQHSDELVNRLTELGDAADTLDEWAEKYTDEFNQNLDEYGSDKVRQALVARPRIERALAPPQPGPIEPAYLARMLRVFNFEGFFSVLLEDRANLDLINDETVGTALDAAAANYPDEFAEWVAWLSSQPNSADAREIILARPGLQGLYSEVKGKERERASADGDADLPPLDLPPLDLPLPPVPSESGRFTLERERELQMRDALSMLEANNLEGLFSVLVEDHEYLQLMNLADPSAPFGRGLDRVAAGRPEYFRQLVDWLCAQPGFADARDVFLMRPDLQAVLDETPVKPVRPVNPAAETAVVALAPAAGYSADDHEDLGTLFNKLLDAATAGDVRTVIAGPIGETLDRMATDYPEIFVGWFDWCNNVEVQTALLGRQAIAEVVALMRNRPAVADPSSRAELEPEPRPVPVQRPRSDLLGSARRRRVPEVGQPDGVDEDDDGQSFSEIEREHERQYGKYEDSDEYRTAQEFAREHTASRLSEAWEYFRGDSPSQLVEWLQDELGSYGSPHDIVDEQWWQGLEEFVRSFGREFTQRVDDAHDPKLDEFLGRSQVVSAVLRNERRSAQLIVVTDDVRQEIDVRNGNHVKKLLQNGESTEWTAGGGLVLIGLLHDPDVVSHVNLQPDRVTGTVSVRKGRTLRGAGDLTFSGCPLAQQELVRSAVQRFSSKNVVFGGDVEQVSSATIRRGRRR